MNPDSDVAYYQLAQAYRALGNTAEQETALAEFNRVRSLAARSAPRCAADQTRRHAAGARRQVSEMMRARRDARRDAQLARGDCASRR